MNVENNELLLRYHSFLLDDIKTRKIEININSLKCALFIYFQNDPYFIKLLYINIFNLGNEWNYTIICCYDNYEFVKNSCLEISENINIITVDKYENFMFDLNFWNDIKYESLLLFDEKTLILNNLNKEFLDYNIISNRNIIFLKKEIIVKMINKSKINNLKNNNENKIFLFYLFINKFLEIIKQNKLLIIEKTLIFKEEDENIYCSDFYNNKSFSCLNIWLNNQNYHSIIQSKLQLKKKDVELEIILMFGYLNVEIYEKYNVYTSYDIIKFNENQNYLFINGDYDLNVENIKMLEKNFKESYCNVISPLIISHVDELEYFGGVFNNNKYIYIDNKIITLNKVENNEYWANFIQNTMCPYFNLFMIKNVDNIFLKNEYNGFIENVINYSLILKEVKVTPFVKIRNKLCLNIINEIKLNVDNIFPIDLNEKYLVDIYNQYNKNNLVSFKFFENNYYLSLSNKKYILIIEYVKFSPENDCGSLYIFYLIKTLLKLGYQIHFYNIINDVKYNKIFQEMGIYVYESEKKIKNIINNCNVYEYIFISRVYSMNYFYEDVKKYCLKSKIIFITHDINLLKNKKQILYNKNIFYNPSSIDEMKYIELSNISVIVSKYEFEYLKNEEKKEKIIYSPICYEIENDYNRCIENTHDIYFIGSAYHANVDAIIFFLKNHWYNILERINIKLHIIGKVCYNIGNEYKNNSSIVFHNCVSVDKISDLLKKFRMCIVPLRYGGGIKGKILQSFNLKIPCLASKVAVEGMEIVENENIIVEYFDNNFAEKFVKHYNNIELLNKISENSYNLMKNVYSLEKNEEYVNNIFKNL